jgi:hypothetical protein
VAEGRSGVPWDSRPRASVGPGRAPFRPFGPREEGVEAMRINISRGAQPGRYATLPGARAVACPGALRSPPGVLPRSSPHPCDTGSLTRLFPAGGSCWIPAISRVRSGAAPWLAGGWYWRGRCGGINLYAIIYIDEWPVATSLNKFPPSARSPGSSVAGRGRPGSPLGGGPSGAGQRREFRRCVGNSFGPVRLPASGQVPGLAGCGPRMRGPFPAGGRKAALPTDVSFGGQCGLRGSG